MSKTDSDTMAPDSKFISALKAFAIVTTAAAIPAGMIGLWVIPKAESSPTMEAAILNTLFTGGWTLAAGFAAYTIADAKVGPKVEKGLSKKTVFAGLFTGLAAAGLLSWQLHAGDAEKKPVTPTRPEVSLMLPKLAK